MLEKPRRRIEAGVLAALALSGLCGPLLTSCRAPDIVLDFRGDAGLGGSGGGSMGETCSGTCEPYPSSVPFNKEHFVLLSVVPEGQTLPPCPQDIAPTTKLDRGYTDIVAPPADCGPCTCQPPTGSCALPTTLTASTAACNLPGMPVSFNAPSKWDGTCTTQDAIAAAPNCPGPTCIQSLTIEPPIVTDPPCALGSPPTTTREKARWAHRARACSGPVGADPCDDLNHFCAPSAALASQEVGAPFMECLLKVGDHDCPHEWPEKHLIYLRDAIADTRTCGGCTCGPPVGSKCSTTVSVYTDDKCGVGNPGTLAITLNVDSTKSNCGGVLSGSALGSKTATTPVYEPGSCAASKPVASGDATGDDQPTDNINTACCRGVPH